MVRIGVVLEEFRVAAPADCGVELSLSVPGIECLLEDVEKESGPQAAVGAVV